MKKTLFLLLLCAFAGFQALAQVTLRPYLGLNSSELSEDLVTDSFTFANNVGFQLGADLQFGDKFYVQPGVQIEFLNNTIEPLDGEGEDFKRSYLRIPVMVGYNFGGAESTFGFRVFTGPNVAFNLGSNSDYEDTEEAVKDAIFGWNAGLGIDLISILFVDLGYQIGLSDVIDDPNFNSGIRNNLFYANAGLRVRF